MGSAERFMFDRCFDDIAQSLGGGGSSGNAAGPAPLYAADDLAGARSEAYAEGYAEGHAAASAAAEVQRQAFEGRVEQTLDVMAREIARLLERTDAAAIDLGRQAVLVASAIARKLLPRLYREHARSEIEDVVARAFLPSPADRPLIVRMAPPLADDLATRLAGGLAGAVGLEKRVQVVGDPTIADGDCRIEWPGGGLIRDQERLWREIEAFVGDAAAIPALSPPPQGPNTAPLPAQGPNTASLPPQASNTAQPTGDQDD